MAIRIQGDVVIYDDKVFRPAQMTTSTRNSISSPQAGMVIYNTTEQEFQGYDGSAWGALGGEDDYARTIAYIGL